MIRDGVNTPIPYFRENRLIRLDSHTLDGMDDRDFSDRAYAWRGRAVIRRNVALFEINKERREP